MGPRLIGGLTLYAHSFGNDKAYPEVHHTDRAIWMVMPHRKERGNGFILHALPHTCNGLMFPASFCSLRSTPSYQSHTLGSV